MLNPGMLANQSGWEHLNTYAHAQGTTHTPATSLACRRRSPRTTGAPPSSREGCNNKSAARTSSMTAKRACRCLGPSVTLLFDRLYASVAGAAHLLRRPAAASARHSEARSKV